VKTTDVPEDSDVALADAARIESERARRLEQFAVALSDALDRRDVVRVMLDEGLSAAGAQAGAVLLHADTGLDMIDEAEYRRERRVRFRTVPIDSPFPAAVAFRDCRPVWIRSEEEWRSSFPEVSSLRIHEFHASALLEWRARRAGSLSAEEVHQQVTRIDSTATKMDALIGTLLDLTRMELNHPLDLVRAPTDLVALVRQVVGIQRFSDRHRVVVAAAEERLIGQWDALRLERVVVNLIGNAVKYSPGGGEIHLELKRESSWAILSVVDTGMGIPADELPRIFERFFRAATSSTTLRAQVLGSRPASASWSSTAASCWLRVKRERAAPSLSACRSSSSADRLDSPRETNPHPADSRRFGLTRVVPSGTDGARPVRSARAPPVDTESQRSGLSGPDFFFQERSHDPTT
jgi:signal transduction histidine kinase